MINPEHSLDGVIPSGERDSDPVDEARWCFGDGVSEEEVYGEELVDFDFANLEPQLVDNFDQHLDEVCAHVGNPTNDMLQAMSVKERAAVMRNGSLL